MYNLRIEEKEGFNSETNEFVIFPGGTLQLEHSLISISEWEAKWKRAFLSEKEGPQTYEEQLDYIRCMTLNRNVDPNIYVSISNADIKEVMEYVNDTMTATTFNERNGRKKRHAPRNQRITNEVIYWQMSQWGIPFECEKWHLNRLLTLIRVCAEKGEPPQKMSEKALLQQYAGVNAKRRRPKKH